MKNYIVKFGAFLVMLLSFQIAVSQDIIMENTHTPMLGIEDQARYFYDPGGWSGNMGSNQDTNGYFAQNLKDTMTLGTTWGTCVLYVLFEEFSMSSGDTLWIFDGANCNAQLIGAYNLVNSPGEIFASGKRLTFVFHSDNLDIPGLQDGWKAKVMAYDTAQQDMIMGIDVYNMTCNAYFYDSGGPMGNIVGNSENSYAQFSSPIGTHIKCEFTEFAVNGILKIYDGLYHDQNKRLIGQFCSSTLNSSTGNKPPILFSSGSSLTFIYEGASGDVNRSGWKAEISCVTELFESPDGSACPEINIVTGGAYSDVPNPNVIDFDCSKPIVVLDAEVIATGPYSNDYTVRQIPYDEDNMLFGYNEGTVVDANTDDNWITHQPLGFSFAFFGNTYSSVYPGANGLISFNQQNLTSSTACSWSTSVPSTQPPYSSTPYNFTNCIYGVYEDINPDNDDCPSNGTIRYGVLGTQPCRAFVFNYRNIGLYDCCGGANTYNTYQMVMYEGTNIIDIYIKHRANCPSWNGARGVIGLQNNTSSQILTAPNRDFFASWTADNEAWRFTPITTMDPEATLTWYKNSVSSSNVLSTGLYDKSRKITVSPHETTRYIAEYTFTNAAGDEYVLRDTTLIKVSIPSVTATSNTGDNNICPGNQARLNAATGNEFPMIHPSSYQWDSDVSDTNAVCNVNPTKSTTYTVTVTFDNGCTNFDTVRVYVTDLEFPTITGTDSVCDGVSSTLVATHPSSNEFHWSSGQSTATITVTPHVTTEYVVSATMTGNCIVTDTFTVTVLPLPRPAFLASPTEIFVENGIGSVSCTNLSPDGYSLLWNFGDPFSNTNIVEDMEDPTHDYTRAGYYTITLTAEDSLGCVDSTKSRVSVSVPYFFYVPNAFTPDGDGINETFAPKGAGVDPDNYMMQIFDRSGMLIFSTRDPFDYWDGRNKYGQLCPEGVYVYLIRLKDLNAEDKEYTGTVTLVR